MRVASQWQLFGTIHLSGGLLFRRWLGIFDSDDIHLLHDRRYLLRDFHRASLQSVHLIRNDSMLTWISFQGGRDYLLEIVTNLFQLLSLLRPHSLKQNKLCFVLLRNLFIILSLLHTSHPFETLVAQTLSEEARPLTPTFRISRADL